MGIYGFDVSQDAIKEAHKQSTGTIFQHSERYKSLSFDSDFFDIIICTFVISTIPRDKLKLFFQTIYEVINKKAAKFIVVINNPKEYIDTRFAGIQIVSDGRTQPKLFDNVIIKFYHGLQAKEPFITDVELWRSTEFIMEMMTNIFGSECSVTSEDLMYIDEYKDDVVSLGIDLNEIEMEKKRAPFTAIIVTMNSN